jgi:sugar O-acyltransferase (sialic acid O-acetyltransferase NeuD family)
VSAAKVVIFGRGKIGDVMHYYMTEESDLRVVGFTCDKEYIQEPAANGLPVVAFDEVEKHFPPDEFKMFVAVGYQGLNDLRASKFADAKAKGYSLVSYVHKDAGVPTGTPIGENCCIMGQVCIQPKARLGDNVFIWSGAMIGHHSVIGDHCWVTGRANISGSVIVGNNCFFAVNATVTNDIRIGNRCIIGANTLVTKDLQDGQVVIERSSDVFRLNSDQFLKITRLT